MSEFGKLETLRSFMIRFAQQLTKQLKLSDFSSNSARSAAVTALYSDKIMSDEKEREYFPRYSPEEYRLQENELEDILKKFEENENFDLAGEGGIVINVNGKSYLKANEEKIDDILKLEEAVVNGVNQLSFGDRFLTSTISRDLVSPYVTWCSVANEGKRSSDYYCTTHEPQVDFPFLVGEAYSPLRPAVEFIGYSVYKTTLETTYTTATIPHNMYDYLPERQFGFVGGENYTLKQDSNGKIYFHYLPDSENLLEIENVRGINGYLEKTPIWIRGHVKYKVTDAVSLEYKRILELYDIVYSSFGDGETYEVLEHHSQYLRWSYYFTNNGTRWPLFEGVGVTPTKNLIKKGTVFIENKNKPLLYKDFYDPSNPFQEELEQPTEHSNHKHISTEIEDFINEMNEIEDNNIEVGDHYIYWTALINNNWVYKPIKIKKGKFLLIDTKYPRPWEKRFVVFNP